MSTAAEFERHTLCIAREITGCITTWIANSSGYAPWEDLRPSWAIDAEAQTRRTHRLGSNGELLAPQTSKYDAPTAASSLPAEDFSKLLIQIIERAGTIARETRPMHDGEGFRFQVRELLEVARSQRGVRNIIRKNSCLVSFHGLIGTTNHILRGQRLDIAGLMEQVRTEQGFLCFFEERSRVPPVRQMGCLAVAEAV